MDVRRRTAGSEARTDEPGWTLAYLETAATEGHKILSDAAYAHVVQQFDDLAFEQEPVRSQTQDVRSIDRFFELREKGGLLGRINLRVFFFTYTRTNVLCVLGCYKKEEEHRTPNRIVVRMRNRMREARKQLDAIERNETQQQLPRSDQ